MISYFNIIIVTLGSKLSDLRVNIESGSQHRALEWS